METDVSSCDVRAEAKETVVDPNDNLEAVASAMYALRPHKYLRFSPTIEHYRL
jgi:hypothetical protein